MACMRHIIGNFTCQNLFSFCEFLSNIFSSANFCPAIFRSAFFRIVFFLLVHFFRPFFFLFGISSNGHFSFRQLFVHELFRRAVFRLHCFSSREIMRSCPAFFPLFWFAVFYVQPFLRTCNSSSRYVVFRLHIFSSRGFRSIGFSSRIFSSRCFFVSAFFLFSIFRQSIFRTCSFYSTHFFVLLFFVPSFLRPTLFSPIYFSVHTYSFSHKHFPQWRRHGGASGATCHPPNLRSDTPWDRCRSE